jgi:hypothetical protein
MQATWWKSQYQGDQASIGTQSREFSGFEGEADGFAIITFRNRWICVLDDFMICASVLAVSMLACFVESEADRCALQHTDP